MKRLKHTGLGYHGALPEGGTIFAKAGEVVEVSDAKADQLFADFPGEWAETTEELGGGNAMPPAAPAVPAAGEDVEDDEEPEAQARPNKRRR